MARSTVHYADNATNTTLKKLHNKLRPAGTPVQRVEYIIELLLLRIFETKLKHDPEFQQLRPLFKGEYEFLLFSSLSAVPNEQILATLNTSFFPFYASILSKARKVIKGNPSIKVQDQLVLIEEVFSNSNFTNNVNSGNLQEVISLVGELDENRLLKTDLLGDAIESALSETGGTKDIGLYRTPDHVRQFMVGLVQPGFEDLIFDPACGTGGFLFDAFEYVMEGVTKNGSWPGAKAHPELAAWFKDHFADKPAAMPSVETSTDFYRNGVMGVEYLGMIRKMASINFYIRGLNPGNILQGDSLARFKKDFDPESKTAILANPPFGAERDQESYTDVWAEYPKESETTILFVKLMLETLKKGGRCAVVVSEGFMTWDQNSARALRKQLLEDANLRAVISLPQGLFVSKSGQGPKTSILYFEKGEPTRNVWFYKVSNDGYSMGTNRKTVAGCQLVEALDHFNRYVKQGEISPETRHSFSIPADWIKTLDPRVKERIRNETTEELTAKAKEERAKLADTLARRLADKKITRTEIADRLAQHDQLWKGKISATIAQKIERAHLYSFNLPNYRSSLAAAQVQAWHAFVGSKEKGDNDTPPFAKGGAGGISEPTSKYKPLPKTPLDEQYELLKSSPPAELDRLLSSLDPRNSLELDMARQFLSALSPETLAAHPHLQTLSGIISSVEKYPRIVLKELLDPVSRKITLEYDETYKLVTVKLYGKGVILRGEYLGSELKGNNWFRVRKGDVIFSKIDARHGAFGLVPEQLDNAIVTSEFPSFEVRQEESHPGFLTALLTSKKFYGQIEEMVSGASGRRRVEPDSFLDLAVPQPLLEVQELLIAEIDRLRAIIVGAELVLENWLIDALLETEGDSIPLGKLVEVDAQIIKDLEPVSNKIYVGGENIESGTGRLLKLQTVEEAGIIGPSYSFTKDQIVYSKVRPNLRKCFLSEFDGVCSSDIYPYSVITDKVMPQYMAMILASQYFADMTVQFHERAGMPKINREQLATISVTIPSIEVQEQAVKRYRREKNLLDELRRTIIDSQDSITSRINKIWEH
jgi:type I restriction enzyme M protein